MLRSTGSSGSLSADCVEGALREEVLAHLTRLMIDDGIGHIWQHHSQGRVMEEHQNFVDWLCAHWCGPMMYRGRDLVTVHRGMGITERHWVILFD